MGPRTTVRVREGATDRPFCSTENRDSSVARSTNPGEAGTIMVSRSSDRRRHRKGYDAQVAWLAAGARSQRLGLVARTRARLCMTKTQASPSAGLRCLTRSSRPPTPTPPLFECSGWDENPGATARHECTRRRRVFHRIVRRQTGGAGRQESRRHPVSSPDGHPGAGAPRTPATPRPCPPTSTPISRRLRDRGVDQLVPPSWTHIWTAEIAPLVQDLQHLRPPQRPLLGPLCHCPACVGNHWQ